MIVIADAGPLIALAKIGALDPLIRLYNSIITPPAVYAEAVTAGSLLGADDATLLEKVHVSLRADASSLFPSILRGMVVNGEGEAEVRRGSR